MFLVVLSLLDGLNRRRERKRRREKLSETMTLLYTHAASLY